LKQRCTFFSNKRQAIARNFGAAYAKGEYLIFLDSDVIVPQKYLEIVNRELEADPVDAYGGPDKAAPDFNNLQKAISYSMTSFLTSGRIRSGQKLDRYYPRSYNMGKWFCPLCSDILDFTSRKSKFNKSGIPDDLY